MDDRAQLIELSERLAGAISRRDVAEIRGFLARGFVQRPTGGDAVETDAFLRGITQIPGDILFVRVEQLTVDVAGEGALVTGLQQAQLKIDGAVVIDRHPFVDLFVKEAGDWRLRVAIDLPATGS